MFTGLYYYNDRYSNPLLDPILSVVQQIVHPDYGVEYTPKNDVLLLRLNEPVYNIMQPIALHRDDSSLTSFGGYGSNSLLFADVNYVSNMECQDSYNSFDLIIPDSEICASEDGKDACQGDRGGPLVYLGCSSDESLLVGFLAMDMDAQILYILVSLRFDGEMVSLGTRVFLLFGCLF